LEAVVDVPAGLGVRGLDVWEALSGTDKVRNALALEAARLADRLDELDSIIQGKGVLNLMQFRLESLPSGDGEPFVVEVKFQSVLSEARQQQLAFANVLKALAAGGESAAFHPAAASNVTPLAAVIGRGLKKG
jgi:hypothetical protein